ncbi:VOC family protein [Rheinheimera muenzenbergensis]|uniref:VOC family protein n=1 Tax=Rheinheimera muenzenbergensis TaxID=1193628 RepID=A0ABU8C1G6_9GAMM
MLQLKTEQPQRHPEPTVKATKLAYLAFELPDLEQAEQFLTDFGLIRVQRDEHFLYLRSTDAAPFCYRVAPAEKPKFSGFGLVVDSMAALEKLAQLTGASAIEALSSPGGGWAVQLQDPSGFNVTALFGQQQSEALTHRTALDFNFDGKAARINSTQRPPALPPEILKLGHLVLEVADFQASCAWYCQHFGFIPSDVQLLPDGSPAVVFMRLDLADTPSDHHTLAIAQGFMPCYSHSAFELVDADAVGMGQRLMREKGWSHSWGIGRHILGSQIFDYWRDPWGFKLEHYCDGDLFTSDVPMGVHPVSRQAMSQWGQPMPANFTKPKLTLAGIRAIFHHLRHSPDLTFRKLITLAKLFG